MKKNISLILILAASISGLLWSCSKATPLENIAVTKSPNGSAFIKIVHFSPAFRLVTSKSDSLNIFMNVLYYQLKNIIYLKQSPFYVQQVHLCVTNPI